MCESSNSDSSPSLEIKETLLIGENDRGYQFCVGLIGDRWCGFALGRSSDRDEAIRKTGAIACDPESAYGGVTRWYVDEPLRGDPEDFRCAFCGDVDCDGTCRDDEFEFDCGGL